ncbi:MAG: alpha/beta hydrolase, partial [Bacteroidales bacterium]
MKRYLLFILFIITTMVAFSQDITGEWDGTLNVQNTPLRLVFHINKTDTGYSATMDSPDQGAKGIIMSHVTLENSILTIELRIAKIKYTGTIDKNAITGIYSQDGQS